MISLDSLVVFDTQSGLASELLCWSEGSLLSVSQREIVDLLAVGNRLAGRDCWQFLVASVEKPSVVVIPLFYLVGWQGSKRRHDYCCSWFWWLSVHNAFVL